MRRKLYALTMVLGVLLMATVILVGFGETPSVVHSQDGTPGQGAIPEFVGSLECRDCHEGIDEAHVRMGHNFKLNRVVDGQPPEYPYSEVTDTPEGYTWDDISFVIGGYAWKARFIDQRGFIITGDEDATTQYNFPLVDEVTGDVIAEAAWVGYHAGEVDKPYNCGECHTSGHNHDPETNMYDLEGLVGQWVAQGIQCEECHGTGSLHVQAPIQAEMRIDRDKEAGSGQCHYRGSEGVVEAGGGFIKHHEQYEEILTAPHATMDCIDCHNPHQSAIYADEEFNPNRCQRNTCTNCHVGQTASRPHVASDVTCMDCHMAPMTASGNRNAELLWADVSTHLFQINVDANAPQFNEEGTAVMPYITVQYACTRCHSDWTVEEMAEAAAGYHSGGME